MAHRHYWSNTSGWLLSQIYIFLLPVKHPPPPHYILISRQRYLFSSFGNKMASDDHYSFRIRSTGFWGWLLNWITKVFTSMEPLPILPQREIEIMKTLTRTGWVLPEPALSHSWWWLILVTRARNYKINYTYGTPTPPFSAPPVHPPTQYPFIL